MTTEYIKYEFTLTRAESKAFEKYITDEKLNHFDKQAVVRAIDKILNREDKQ